MDATDAVFYEKIHLETRTSMRVLYLSEWYPNRYDASNGRFVRAHATSAIKQGIDVCVLYLYAIPKGDKEILFEQTTEGVREVYIYYRGLYIAALHKGWQYVQRHWGRPNMCQLNVITKNAILPLWLHLTQDIPYIIVEHWTGYYPESGAFKGFFRHWFARIVVRHARMVLTVSTELAEQMRRHGLEHSDYRLIRNVVYDLFFERIDRPQDGIKRILHVSFMDDAHKNVRDILRAIQIISKERQDFELVMVGGNGEKKASAMQFAEELAIPTTLIRWTGEIDPKQVCDLFYQSDFFVFYSNFETAGIVLTESLICGKPVITTAVGIAPDIITQETGLLVPKRQPEELAKAIDWMLDHYQEYNPQKLRTVGELYSEENVGKYLKSTYYQVSKNS